jgi:hypothetical protein
MRLSDSKWTRLLALTLALLTGGAPTSTSAQTGGLDALQRGFATPPDDARVMMRWWWFGPAVTKERIERELRLMKEGGVGGVEIQPVYPVVLDDPQAGVKTLPFLSDEFIDALRFANRKARELGLRVDLTVGSGWPFGGPSVPVTEAAGRLRVERVRLAENQRRVPLPSVGAGEKLIAAFLDHKSEITEVKDGAAWLPAGLAGQHEVQFFVSSRTGQQVKRPAVGAEGFVLDHYDRAAVESYLQKVGERLMQAFAGQPPYAVFCDSLEVFNSDWTPDFLAEFQKRRGYDLKPHLPALITDIGPQTAAIRHDWGQTLTDLLNERFLMPMREWAKKHHTRFRIQGYGIPPATIASNANVDLTEGEGPQWKTLRASRWASSANHVYGRNVTSSETWTWLHSPSFRATPLDMKAEADLHFLQGVNQLIGHGWPYTPDGVEYPGWRFYAAAVFNEKNPWWHVMPDVSAYLQRVSWLLRQGRPANDIAFYLPNSDAWAGFINGKVHYMIEALRDRVGDDVIARTLEAGYNLDFFDDDVLRQVGKVERDSLVLGENKYRAVILPNVERIPLDTLRRLEEFAENGGLVIATRRAPALAPGLKASDAEQQQIRDISRRLFEGPDAKGHLVTDENAQLAAKLHSLLRPDVDFSAGKAELGFIHRRTPDAEIYFVANTSNERQNVMATFRVSGWLAELWNPLTGEAQPAFSVPSKAGRSTVRLDLEPYGSRVVVFAKPWLPRMTLPVSPIIPAPLDLSTGWRVSFGEGGRAVMTDKLRSWTEEEGRLYYSGVAAYEKEFNVPPNFFDQLLTVKLDFGEGEPVAESRLTSGMRAWLDAPVRDAAVVYVNGRRAGAVWAPPYAIDVTKLLLPGDNRLRVVVGNTAMNHMAGRKLPDYRLLNLRYGERFQPQDMDKVKPLPSGLLGPVRLIATERVR